MKLLRRVATPMAIGVIAVIAPVEVSVAIEIKQEMIKSPATINLWGIKVWLRSRAVPHSGNRPAAHSAGSAH